MTDRELLELAAKAAWIDGKYSDEYGEATFIKKNTDTWNPLTDDGDALRLAVKLRLLGSEDSCLVTAMYELGDPLAATRRAIVRAAAAIGEQP